jgi:hypothetical protein
MLSGLYKVEFQTPIGAGAGVVISQNGKIQGGDSSMYYIGDYSEKGTEFTASVEGKTHRHLPGGASVFGVNHTHIKLTGKIDGDSAVMQGRAAEAPNILFQARLTKVH